MRISQSSKNTATWQQFNLSAKYNDKGAFGWGAAHTLGA
jgi:hypothetical protein